MPGREEPIPNKNVVIRDNIVLNPDGFQSQWPHFAVAPPGTPSAGSNRPSSARADDGLQIFGNVIWNGPAPHPLGIEQPALAADVAARNAINTVRPVLVDPARRDFRVVTGVTRDDFVLSRGNRLLSLAGASITTSDNQTFTISGLRGTNLAGSYSLRLKAAGTGIADAWATTFARPTTVGWRMTRTVRA